jgi:uncharacterized protein (TIGR03437 family)
MRVLLLILSASALFAQQPILYNRGTINAASLAPFGLPNASIARGSIFTTFGENLGPASGQQVSAFPLGNTFAEVSMSVTQNGVTTAAIPIFVSATQVNAIMPSTVTAGLATLRLTYQTRKSNALTIQIADSSPGVFGLTSGGYGPSVVQNFVNNAFPVNSLKTPATRGQLVIIWATGLGPVAFPDNVAPTAGDVAAAVSVTIGGRPAKKTYSGRSGCCSGLDEVFVEIPADAPLGCWVPVVVTAGGVVSNTTTIAIAAAGATSCDDPGNPLSTLVRTPGSQAFIHVEHIDSIENTETAKSVAKSLDKIYSRFYTRPDSQYSFDPYMSYPPAGACLVHQTSGDATYDKSFRGALPASANLDPQPAQSYNNGSQVLNIPAVTGAFSSTVGGTVDADTLGMSLLGTNGSFTIDPGGSNQKVIPLTPAASPGWTRPTGILVVPRSAPLVVNFSPGDASAPTVVLLYSYTAQINTTVEVQCLAAPGATSFTIPSESLANLPATYGHIDGSYATLSIGTLGTNKATTFTSALAANGVVLNSNWMSQSVVLQ